MGTINCYVVDDESDSIELISDFIRETPELRLVFSSTNPRDLIAPLTKDRRPKLTFLDIEMPGIDGINLSRLVKGHSPVIFVTAHPHHAVEAFDEDAYDYLLKPVSYERFLQAVTKATLRGHDQPGPSQITDKYFFVRNTKEAEVTKVNFNEVLLVEAEANYFHIHTVGRKQFVYGTLKEIEDILWMPNFMRVHRCYIVNIDRIKSIQKRKLTMDNGTVVPVGDTYFHNLHSRLDKNTFTTSKRRDN